MGRLTVTVAVRMRPEEAEAVRAEAQRSGRSLAAMLLAGAGLPHGAAAAVPVGGAGVAAVLPDDLAELRARVDALELRAEIGNRRRDDRRRPTPTTAAPSPTPEYTLRSTQRALPPTTAAPSTPTTAAPSPTATAAPSPKRNPSPTTTDPSAGSLALRAWAEAEGLTVGTLADRLDAPRGTVGAWLTARRPPPPPWRDRLADLAGIPVDAWE